MDVYLEYCRGVADFGLEELKLGVATGPAGTRAWRRRAANARRFTT